MNVHLHQRRLRHLTLAGLFILAAGLLIGTSYAQEKPDFTRWEKAIADFEVQDRAKPPPRNAILFAGSSSIRRWDVRKSFPDAEVINRGFGGSQIADSVHFAPRIIVKHQPRLIVFYAGDNDIAGGKSPEQVAADFQAFVKVIHDELPKTRIIYISIKPSILRWSLIDKVRQANALIESSCKQNDQLLYIDVVKPMLGEDGKPRPELFVADGLHLNAKGYELWSSILKPHLK